MSGLRHPLFSGVKLKQRRVALKMSRLELARRINFLSGPEAIARYENGTNAPSVNIAIAIADVLGVRLEVLTDAQG